MNDSPEASLDDLVAECSERLDQDGIRALDDLCARHPRHADALRRAMQPLLDFGVVGPSAPTAQETPVAIGALRVTGKLGEGAFGIVYLCAQSVPVQRTVAVKVLRPGAGTSQTLRRFDAERQILARMNHPAIANVFDAGALADGRPYFVMEYVAGAPITDFCDRHRFSVTARLELFLRLCDGVQHAHHKGILHRDLKPSNVLVQHLGGHAQPKIIDFGLAKAMHEPESDQTQLTEAGRMLGTPGFASPEQAQGRHDDVDTRSDVFSLGVLLHVLLTGASPWPRGASAAEGAPERPSTKVPQAGEQASRIATERGTEPQRLRSRLRGDLDWIVLRALEAERERRYQTVRELAEDVRRHLAHEPVQAGPPSALYRARKFVRRYRIQVGSAGAVLLSLVLGLIGTWRYASLAQGNLERFELLAIGSRLNAARDVASQLRPAWPEKLPEFERWLAQDLAPLRRDLPRVRAALAELRARALPYTAADQELDRRQHPAAAEIARRQARIDYARTLLAHDEVQDSALGPVRTALTGELERFTGELPALEQAREERRTWRFARDGEQFLHDTMTRLEQELAQFCDGPGAVAQTLTAQRDSILAGIAALQARSGRWQEVRAEVAADARYGGLALAPQFDLIPLGRDPQSGLQEFYHVPSAPPEVAVPGRNAEGRLQLELKSGIVFVLVPGGRATIGAQRSDPARAHFDAQATAMEAPVHEVPLAPFFLGKHEVTQSQWWCLTATTPSHFHKNLSRRRRITERNPVENLSWDEATRGLERHGLDLPTEAQWEYACRAGDRETADTLLAQAEAAGAGATDVDRCHVPVGRAGANGFGLCDLLGNVHEWCRDTYSAHAYLLPPRAGDGLHPVPELTIKVVRGGAYDDAPGVIRAAARWPVSGTSRTPNLGIRAVRRVVGAEPERR